MYGLSYGLVYVGQQFISSATAAVLFASFPFFVASVSWWKCHTEKLSRMAWFGMILGFLGVVAISYDSLGTSQDVFLGTLFLIAGSLASAYGIVIHKRDFSQVNIVVAANVQMILGGLFLLAGALIFDHWSDFNLSAKAVGSVVYLALGGTVVTFLGYYWLLQRIRLTVVSLIAFITPLIAILIGVILADETLSPLIVVGAVMILSSVLLVIRE